MADLNDWPHVSHWADVTEVFFRGCDALSRDGELLSTPDFCLRQVISAVDVMHPKMDSGYMAEDELPAALGVFRAEFPPTSEAEIARRSAGADPRAAWQGIDQAFDAGMLRTEGFSAAELVGIIDDLLAEEMVLHAGNSLAPSLGSSLYLQRPDRIKCPVLHAYCHNVLRCMDAVTRAISASGIGTDEEPSSSDATSAAVPNFLQVNLPAFPTARCMSMLEACMQAIQAATRQCLNPAGAPATAQHRSIYTLHADDTPRALTALGARLSLRLKLLDIYHNSPHMRNLNICNVASLQQTLRAVDLCMQTVDQGATPPAPDFAPAAAGGVYAFDRRIARKMFSFPSSTAALTPTREEAYAQMAAMLRHLVDASNLLLMTSEVGEFIFSLKSFLFTAPFPNLFVRSTLRLTLFDGGTNLLLLPRSQYQGRPMSDLMLGHICHVTGFQLTGPHDAELIASGEVPPGLRDIVQPFLAECHAFLSTCLIYLLQNRGRALHSLRRSIAESDGLRRMAVQTDAKLQAALAKWPHHATVAGDAGSLPGTGYFQFLHNYAVHLKLSFMRDFLALGTELRLYNPHELASVYWYQSYLAASMQNLHRTMAARVQQMAAIRDAAHAARSAASPVLSPGAAKKGGKKKSPPGPRRPAASPPAKPLPLPQLLSNPDEPLQRFDAAEVLAQRAMLLALAALQHAGVYFDGAPVNLHAGVVGDSVSTTGADTAGADTTAVAGPANCVSHAFDCRFRPLLAQASPPPLEFKHFALSTNLHRLLALSGGFSQAAPVPEADLAACAGVLASGAGTTRGQRRAGVLRVLARARVLLQEAHAQLAALAALPKDTATVNPGADPRALSAGIGRIPLMAFPAWQERCAGLQATISANVEVISTLVDLVTAAGAAASPEDALSEPAAQFGQCDLPEALFDTRASRVGVLFQDSPLVPILKVTSRQ